MSKTKVVEKPVVQPAVEAAQEEPQQTTDLAEQGKSTTEISTEVHIDFGEDAEQFESNFQASDFQMPFLQILQANSPQCTEGHAKQIEGAKAGMFLDTASGEIYDTRGTKNEPGKPIMFIVVSYRKTFIEWRTREAGGGFIKDHGAEGAKLIQKCIKDEKGRQIMPDTDGENQLVETAQYVIMYQNSESNWIPAMLTFTSTQLKKSRLLNTTLSNLKINVKGKKVTPPYFYSVFTDGPTVLEQNDKGSWFGHVIARHCDTVEMDDGRALYLMARDLRKSIDEGVIDLTKAAEAERQAGGEVEDANTGGSEGGNYADASRGAF